MYIKLSPEEQLRIYTLNDELKRFGFSLDSSIDEVFEKYHKEELQKEKIQRLKTVHPKWFRSVLGVYLVDLKEETKHKETNSTYDIVRVMAYDITTLHLITYQVEKKYHVDNRKVSVDAFQLFLYEQHAKYPPTNTPERHIELCLQAITRGVELAKFIPDLEKEIESGNIKPRKVSKNKKGG